MKKRYFKHITQEETLKARIWKYAIFMTVILILGALSYIFAIKNDNVAVNTWWSNLCMNFSAGTAVTLFFYYFGNVRIIKYRLQTALNNLLGLIHHTYFYLDGLESSSDRKRANSFIELINYKVIDTAIIEANRPLIYKQVQHYMASLTELKSEILKENRIEIYEVDKIADIVTENGLEINANQKLFINALREICDCLNELIRNETG